MIDWIRTHQAIFALLIWPVLSGMVTTLFRKPTPEFSQKYPRLAALRRIPSDAGVNVPKLLENLLTLVLGKKSSPTLPLLLCIILLPGVLGCALTAAAAYKKQQEACVEESKTREESRECRARVRHEWGTDLEPTTTVSDAGADHAAE